MITAEPKVTFATLDDGSNSALLPTFVHRGNFVSGSAEPGGSVTRECQGAEGKSNQTKMKPGGIALVCEVTHPLIIRIPVNNGKAGTGVPRGSDDLSTRTKILHTSLKKNLKKLLEKISMQSDSGLRKTR